MEVRDEAPGKVIAQGVWTPDPDHKKLAATKSGTFDKKPIAGTVAFCVATTGKTVDVRSVATTKDAKVDEILTATVQQWRFKPFVVNGKSMKTCSNVTFNLKFR